MIIRHPGLWDQGVFPHFCDTSWNLPLKGGESLISPFCNVSQKWASPFPTSLGISPGTSSFSGLMGPTRGLGAGSTDPPLSRSSDAGVFPLPWQQPWPKCRNWPWVKNGYETWNPGKWKRGLKPAVCWWISLHPYPYWGHE